MRLSRSRPMCKPFSARASTASLELPDTRLHGRWLIVAHIVWGLAVLLNAALFLFDVPALFAVVHQPCFPHSAAACIPAQLSLADFRALGGPGPALDAYALYVLVTVLAASLVFIAVGGLIARRKWDNLMGLFTSLVFISYGGPALLHFCE